MFNKMCFHYKTKDTSWIITCHSNLLMNLVIVKDDYSGLEP